MSTGATAYSADRVEDRRILRKWEDEHHHTYRPVWQVGYVSLNRARRAHISWHIPKVITCSTLDAAKECALTLAGNHFDTIHGNTAGDHPGWVSMARKAWRKIKAFNGKSGDSSFTEFSPSMHIELEEGFTTPAILWIKEDAIEE